MKSHKIQFKRFSVILGIGLLLCCLHPVQANAKTKTKVLNMHIWKVKQECRLYKKADENSKRLGKLKADREVVKLGRTKVDGVVWYQVGTRLKGKYTKGYVQAKALKELVCKETASTKYLGLSQSNTAIWEKPTEYYKKVKYLKKGKEVVITKKISIHGQKWYKVVYGSGKNKKIGYVLKDKIVITQDIAYEKTLLDYPLSYRDSIRKLHKKYPEWEIIPVYTGLSWDDVIENETTVGKNTIMSYVPSGGKVTSFSAPLSYLSTDKGCYNWRTDVYTLIDGTVWYTAAPDVVRYYMDPRNFLDSKNIFRFETMEYDESQTIDGVKQILKGTFMEKNYKMKVTVKVKDKKTKKKKKKTVTKKYSYASTFMEAAKKTGISPYVLAARAKQELSPKGSGSSSGKYKGYKGYYNFYNIGGNDSAGGGAIDNALRYAKGTKSDKSYGRPWNNQKKAIIGGAMFLADKYMSTKQNTLYFQKFNVVNRESLYLHQYMTNIQAPETEARSTYNMYKKMGMLKEKKIFYIPVYENMPKEACRLPEKKGSSNNYLKYLNLKDGVRKTNALKYLNHKFSYKRLSYKMTVPATMSKLRVEARAVNKNCKVSGVDKTYTLKPGKTKIIKIKCRAQSGDERIYKIAVKRKN